MTTGQKIAALRREKGMSQEALGEALGLSRQAVSKWEADQAVPTMDNLVELSRLFGVSVDTLLRQEEALPDKAEEAPADVKITAEGLKVSYAPVLTKKTKWFVIVVAVLIAVSVLGNLYAIVWMRAMQAQVGNLASQVAQISAQNRDSSAVPQSGTADGDGLTDYDVVYQLKTHLNDPYKQFLQISLSAYPANARPDAERAKFIMRSAGEQWTCDAVWQKEGGYCAETEIPLKDSMDVVLMLIDRETDAVRTLPLEKLDGLREEFSLQMDAAWVDGNGITSTDQTTTVKGRLSCRVSHTNTNVDGGFPYEPERCEVLLRQDDKILESCQLTEQVFDEEYGQVYFYGDIDWEAAVTRDQVTLAVQITDTSGRVQEWPIS